MKKQKSEVGIFAQAAKGQFAVYLKRWQDTLASDTLDPDIKLSAKDKKFLETGTISDLAARKVAFHMARIAQIG